MSTNPAFTAQVPQQWLTNELLVIMGTYEPEQVERIAVTVDSKFPMVEGTHVETTFDAGAKTWKMAFRLLFNQVNQRSLTFEGYDKTKQVVGRLTSRILIAPINYLGSGTPINPTRPNQYLSNTPIVFQGKYDPATVQRIAVQVDNYFLVEGKDAWTTLNREERSWKIELRRGLNQVGDRQLRFSGFATPTSTNPVAPPIQVPVRVDSLIYLEQSFTDAVYHLQAQQCPSNTPITFKGRYDPTTLSWVALQVDNTLRLEGEGVTTWLNRNTQEWQIQLERGFNKLGDRSLRFTGHPNQATPTAIATTAPVPLTVVPLITYSGAGVPINPNQPNQFLTNTPLVFTGEYRSGLVQFIGFQIDNQSMNGDVLVTLNPSLGTWQIEFKPGFSLEQVGDRQLRFSGCASQSNPVPLAPSLSVPVRVDELIYVQPSQCLTGEPLMLAGKFDPQRIRRIAIQVDGRYDLGDHTRLFSASREWLMEFRNGFNQDGDRQFHLTALDATGKVVASVQAPVTVVPNLNQVRAVSVNAARPRSTGYRMDDRTYHREDWTLGDQNIQRLMLEHEFHQRLTGLLNRVVTTNLMTKLAGAIDLKDQIDRLQDYQNQFKRALSEAKAQLPTPKELAAVALCDRFERAIEIMALLATENDVNLAIWQASLYLQENLMLKGGALIERQISASSTTLASDAEKETRLAIVAGIIEFLDHLKQLETELSKAKASSAAPSVDAIAPLVQQLRETLGTLKGYVSQGSTISEFEQAALALINADAQEPPPALTLADRFATAPENATNSLLQDNAGLRMTADPLSPSNTLGHQIKSAVMTLLQRFAGEPPATPDDLLRQLQDLPTQISPIEDLIRKSPTAYAFYRAALFLIDINQLILELNQSGSQKGDHLLEVRSRSWEIEILAANNPDINAWYVEFNSYVLLLLNLIGQTNTQTRTTPAAVLTADEQAAAQLKAGLNYWQHNVRELLNQCLALSESLKLDTTAVDRETLRQFQQAIAAGMLQTDLERLEEPLRRLISLNTASQTATDKLFILVPAFLVTGGLERSELKSVFDELERNVFAPSSIALGISKLPPKTTTLSTPNATSTASLAARFRRLPKRRITVGGSDLPLPQADGYDATKQPPTLLQTQGKVILYDRETTADLSEALFTDPTLKTIFPPDKFPPQMLVFIPLLLTQRDATQKLMEFSAYPYMNWYLPLDDRVDLTEPLPDGAIALFDDAVIPDQAPLQTGQNSCAAHAAVTLMNYFVRRSQSGATPISFSSRFLYRVTRKLLIQDMKTPLHDKGVSLRDTVRALNLFGVPPEQYWSWHDQAGDDEEPPPFCYAYAQQFRATHYFRLDRPPQSGKDEEALHPAALLAQIKVVLAAKFPLMFGLDVAASSLEQPLRLNAESEQLYTVIAHQRAVSPDRDGTQAQIGHALVAVGYDDHRITSDSHTPTCGAIKVRNSWGSAWGDNGYAWLPYEYVLQGQTTSWWSLICADWVDSGQFGLEDPMGKPPRPRSGGRPKPPPPPPPPPPRPPRSK